MTMVASPRHSFGRLQVSPDGQRVAYIGARNDGFDAHDLHLQPLSGGPARNLTRASLDRPISSFQWRKDGSFLVLAQTGFSTTFYSVSKEGQAQKGGTFEVQPSSFVEGADFLAFAGETATRLPELWLSRRGGPAEKVTSFNKEWGAITLVKPEIIRYPSFDGTQIEAAFFKPAGYREGTRVPLVVLVHQGPTLRYADSFDDWAQLLAARGFAVITPNIRGSTGYGHAFILLNRFEWGGGDFKDVMAGVDYLIEKGIADAERLGVGGWSYGGFMGAWAVTQTDRFKASVSGAPMTDLASEFGTEDSETNPLDTWNLGTPYENLDLFVRYSPVTFVKNAKTPTLLMCGEKDTIDPIGQCQQFYRGLKRYGVETEFVVYPREPHQPREEKHRIDVLKRMLRWFEKIRG
jgi:dipeptidyl aminopeptidase/acylaminoacyl peptidase